jgi:nicotinic acid phosphoribosyltransferase
MKLKPKIMSHINDDWEREFQKDLVYLLEEKMLMKKEYLEWLKEEYRKPAFVKVIDEDKILNDNEELKLNILPF